MLSFLQNRRISTKLAISGAVGLCLLAALVFNVRTGLQNTDAAIDTTEAAVKREHATSLALEALSLLPPLARDLQMAQDAAAVKAVTDQAQAALATLRQNLATLRTESAAGGALGGHLATAQAAAEGYAAGLDEAAELRRRLLVARDDRLFPQGRTFDFALETVLSGVDLAGLPGNAATEVKDRLATVAQSMFELRVATVQYLATLDAAQRQRANRAIATGRANLRGAMGQDLPEGFKNEVGQLGAAIDTLAEASQNIFTAQAALIANAREKLAPGQQAAVGAMQRVVALTTEEAAAGIAVVQHEIHSALDTLLWLAGAVTLALLVSGWLTARAIARPLAAMAGATARIARGDTARPVDFGPRKDEVGDMARALETLRGVVVKAFAQGQMLEQLPLAVMTADPKNEFRIGYANAQSLSEFHAIEGATGIKASELVGTGMDAFHGGRAGRIRTLLESPSNLPYSARIKLGGETLELRVSALTDPQGGYVGPMLVWTNVSRQVRLADDFERDVGGVVTAVADGAGAMRGVAEALSAAAVDAGHRTDAVAGASAQASQNVSTVAASAEELAASVAEISRQVSESARIAGQAAAEAEATNACVASLSEAANRIGDVVRLIGDIAGQTNLLALNATIEAARAGEAGKGFAVVAGEVKNLAGQTAKATEEIGAQIAAMQGATGQAVGAIRSIGETISRMNEIATTIASAVEEQGAATQEIARSVQQAAAGTAEVNNNIEAVSNAVTQSGTQAGQVLDSATRLTGESTRLRQQVEAFLKSVRAA